MRVKERGWRCAEIELRILLLPATSTGAKSLASFDTAGGGGCCRDMGDGFDTPILNMGG
jgi:hypothetical protein